MLVGKYCNKHRAFAFEVDQITAPLKRVDIRPGLKPFPGFKEEEVIRPIGDVDLLLGIQAAYCFPRTIAVAGYLRLMETELGTGKLIDGCSEAIQAEPVYMDKQSFRYSHAMQI